MGGFPGSLTRSSLALLVLLAAAACSDPFETGRQAFDRGDYAAALEHWRPLAEEGHADAQVFVGLIYNEGKGVVQDRREAAKWFRRAAEAGHPRGSTTSV